jgi:hypothetical protein
MSHLVRFFDIDGTILKQEYVTTGADATAPTTPNIDPRYLVFAEWNQAFTNVQSDLDVGAMYDTIDGKTYIFTRITNNTGFQPTLDLNKSTADLLTIDWGDGTTDTSSVNGSIAIQKSSVYPAIGDYVISIDCAGTYRGSFNVPLYTTVEYASSVLKLYMGSTMTSVTNRTFEGCRAMRFVSLLKTLVFSSPGGTQTLMFRDCFSLIHCNIPKNSTGLLRQFFENCYTLETISLPPSVTIFGTTTGTSSTFSNCINLKSINLKNITSIGTSAFASCQSLTQDILYPSGITTGQAGTFNGCKNLTAISFAGSALTSIGNDMIRGCGRLKSLEFPSTLTSIGTNAFNGNTAILEYTFNSTTPPTLANTNVFTGINAACKIYVPDANVNDYKTATNWSTYANYIYALSTKP